MRRFAFGGLLAVLALGLSSCIIVGTTPVSDFRFESTWRLTSTNEFVLCTNKESRIRYSFRAPSDGTIASVRETYTGLASGGRLDIDRPSLTREGDRLVFEGIVNFGQGGVPQSVAAGVSSQAIVITPIAPPTSQNGQTTLRVTVTTTGGTQYSGSYAYKTYANCP